MNQSGLQHEFIADAVQTAFEFEGVYNLMKMWADESDQKERDEIVADIQDLIDDCAQRKKVEEVYIRFDDLETIASYSAIAGLTVPHRRPFVHFLHDINTKYGAPNS